MTVSTRTSIGHIAAEHPMTMRIFERHHLDYCCNGDRALEEACADRGVEVGIVVREIEEELARAVDSKANVDWSSKTSAELIAHIVEAYHQPLRRELPRLVSLARKVATVHGPQHRSLPILSRAVRALSEDLYHHMAEEEETVFPAILDGAKDGEAIDALEHDHDEAGAALEAIRELTGDYAVPRDACGSWRALWSGLEEFERTMHQHVHLENNVLFPRATG